MAQACLALDDADAVTAILTAIENHRKGWQVTIKPDQNCAWVWAPKQRGSRSHQVVALSGEPSHARSLTEWLRQKKWPIDRWLRDHARVRPPRIVAPKPYPAHWPSDPGKWRFDPHAFQRVQERNVHVYEALACVIDPETTEPNKNFPDRRVAYRGDLRVVYKPRLNLIITVMVLDETIPRQPMIPPPHLLVPDVIGWPSMALPAPPVPAPPALPAVSTPDTPPTEKRMSNKGIVDPVTGKTTTESMREFIAGRIAASRSDQKMLYFTRQDWMIYAQKACPNASDGALAQVLSSAKTKGWVTSSGLPGYNKWSITPDQVKEWERLNPDVIRDENAALAQVDAPPAAVVADVADDDVAEVIAETKTPAPVPSAVRFLAERAAGPQQSLIPHQAAPADPIEIVSEDDMLAAMLAPQPPKTRRASTAPVMWIEALPGTPAPRTVFDAAADLIDPDQRKRMALKPGKPLVIDRVKRDPDDRTQYTIRLSPDGTEYLLIAWQEENEPHQLG